MIALLAEVPYWGQSLLRVLGGLVAVLLPVSDWASKQLEEQGFQWSPPLVQSG